MITLTAKIELSGAYSNLLSAASPSLVDNAEDTEVNSFIIGESRLGEGAVFGGSSSGAITEIVINQRNLISLESSVFDRSNIKLPSWGIISNGGRLEFNDPYGDVKGLAEQNLLTSNQKAEIYLNNTLTKKSEKIAEFYTSDWDYDTNNKTASVTLKDNLEEWQNIQIEGIRYDIKNQITRSAYNLFLDLSNFTPSKYNFIKGRDLDLSTLNQLKRIKLQYPYLERSSLWAAWDKLCVLTQCYIYQHNGKTIFVYKGGN